MTALLWLLAAFTVSGTALHYSPNVMQRVYAVRVRQGLAAPGWYGGLAAVPSCSHIGEVVSASFLNPVSGAWTPYRSMLVVDCAQPYHYAMQIRTGRAIETDWGTAKWAGFTSVGKTKARVIYGGTKE